MDTANAFAVPRRLFAGRKRRADAGNDIDSPAFFAANDFAAFSVRGDAHESRLYEPLETSRQTILTPVSESNSARKRSATMQIKQQSKHLVKLLVEAIESHRIQAPEKMLELDNARRRVSGFSVVQHERYLVLQRKLFQAQQRGLPEVLALSQDEAKQWQQMKAEVEKEQVGFCRMMARSLAVEAALNKAQVPLAAVSWYNAMLAQCWNDIYRLYPRWFEPCVAVKLPTGGVPGGDGSAVVKASEVAARGSCCAIDLRKLVAGQPLRSSADESGGLAMEVVSPRQAISADPQAEELMEKYDCDLAVSSPSLKFQWLSTLFATLGDIPVGNYLLRPQDGYGQSTFGKKRGGAEVLMTADESATDSPVVDLYSFMPKTASPEQAHTLTTPDVVSSTCTVLPSWNLRDRIPYTYQTGMYCLPFFLEGMCPNVSKGESCDLAHLRLPEQQTASSKKPVKAKRWGFENYTNVLKKATRANFEILNRPKWVTLNYAFCGEEKAPSAVSSITDILERLADDLLRKGRGKRRTQKTENRKQHKT
ncbi:hypothetical protein JG688_00010733, partial [Phytophthora aleatoria]